jgi:hypothetical protein
MSMAWLQHLGEPLCRTHEEAERFITAELSTAVPPGWTVERLPGKDLSWKIARASTSGEWSDQDFGVRLTPRLDFVIFTYGNSDAGAFSLGHVLQHALVIEAVALRHYGMAACVEYLIGQCAPNRWGLT